MQYNVTHQSATLLLNCLLKVFLYIPYEDKYTVFSSIILVFLWRSPCSVHLLGLVTCNPPKNEVKR